MNRSDEEAPLLPHVRSHEHDISDRTHKQSYLQEVSSTSLPSLSVLTLLSQKDVLYWSYLLLGFGLLTPWASFMAAVDYIESIYPVSYEKVAKCEKLMSVNRVAMPYDG